MSKPGGTRAPTVALALGGGAARGLAHIAMLEALDEMGIRPIAIAGTSMGAMIGACYAAGMTGKDIRAYCRDILGSRRALMATLVRIVPGKLTTLWSPRRPSVVDGVTLLELLMPEQARCDFRDLPIPFSVVATDFYGIEQVVLGSGPVIPAVAASAALPTIMRPVEIDGRVLIDGGFVNPTPYDIVMDKADITVAVDVTGTPKERQAAELPTTMEAWIGATQILFHSITREKLKSVSPHVFVRPDVGRFDTMDFLAINDILAASEPAKEELKCKLGQAIEAHMRAEA